VLKLCILVIDTSWSCINRLSPDHLTSDMKILEIGVVKKRIISRPLIILSKLDQMVCTCYHHPIPLIDPDKTSGRPARVVLAQVAKGMTTPVL
jgi:hypothetical protein